MSEETDLPAISPDGLRHWTVAGGVVLDHRGLLLVENVRRDGSRDWTPPGGVVDSGETVLEALGREVREETGLVVGRWSPRLYRVTVVAPDIGFHLEVESFRAEQVDGEVHVGRDPDGIVVAAEFVATQVALARMADRPWLFDPLTDVLGDGPVDRHYRYRIDGRDPADRVVSRVDERADDGTGNDDAGPDVG